MSRLRLISGKLKTIGRPDMANDKQRKMSKKEIDAHIAEMNTQIVALLAAAQKVLPPKYQLTLVARHTEMPEANMVWSKEQDMEVVADAILKAGK